jgi:hypothetical protein
MERFSAFFMPYLTTGVAAQMKIVGQRTSLLPNKSSKFCLIFDLSQGV